MRLNNHMEVIKFILLLLYGCSIFSTYSCKSMVIKEEDSASDKTKKVLGRIFLGVGTLGFSEETIENYEKDYREEHKFGALLRNTFIIVIQAVEEIGKAEKEVILLTRDKNEERMKYHLVMVNNFLDNASEKIKKIKDPGQEKAVGEKFKNVVEDIINKKKQVIGYWLKKEIGAAVAYQTLANQKIVEVINEILQLSASNKYVFSQDEVYKIIALREEWAKLTGAKALPQPEPRKIF